MFSALFQKTQWNNKNFENLTFDSKMFSTYLWHKIDQKYIAIRIDICFERHWRIFFFTYDLILYLKRERENCTVNPKDFQREEVKAVCSYFCSVIGNYSHLILCSFVTLIYLSPKNIISYAGLFVCAVLQRTWILGPGQRTLNFFFKANFVYCSLITFFFLFS